MKFILTTAFLFFSVAPTPLLSQNLLPVSPAPSGGACNYAGTITVGPFIGQSNDTDLDTIFLCLGDSLFIDHNGDEVISCDPNPITPLGISYAFYQCQPAMQCNDTLSILSDPCLWPGAGTGFFAATAALQGDAWFFNSGALCNSALFGGGKPVQIFFAPITIDDFYNGQFEDGSCGNANVDAAFSVVYLKEITATGKTTNFGDDCTGRFRLRGGLSEWELNSPYSVDIISADDPPVKAVIHTPQAQIIHGADVIFSVPKPGWYEVTVEDGKSCGAKFQIDMSGCNAADNLNLSLPAILTKPGAKVCLPMKLRNWMAAYASFSISWDPAVLQFAGIQNLHVALKDYTVEVATGSVDAGKMGIVLLSKDPFNSGAIPDGGTLLEFCFEALGASGTASAVRIDNSLIAITNETASGDQPAVSVQDGNVVIKQIIAGPPYPHGGKLMPNPVTGGTPVFFTLESTEATTVSVQVSELTGRALRENRVSVDAGPNQVGLPTTGLPAGCYFISCTAGTGRLEPPQILVIR